MRGRSAVLAVALLLVSIAAPAPLAGLAAAHESGFSVTHEKPVVYPGGTYRLSVHGSDGDDGPYLVILSRRERDVHGLTDYGVDVRAGEAGTFAFDVPEQPRYGPYEAIVINAGPDGRFGDGKSVEEFRRMARNFKERRYEHFKSSVLSMTTDPSATDDTKRVIRFGVGTRGLDVFMPSQVEIGNTYRVTGRYPGRGRGKIRVDFRYVADDRRTAATKTVSVSDGDPDDDDTRWSVEVGTTGMPLGKYDVVVTEGDTPIHHRDVWLLPSRLAGGASSTPLFTPPTRPERPRAMPTAYRWASIAGIDALGVGGGRATVARVAGVEEFEHTHRGDSHEHDHLTWVWLVDPGGGERSTTIRTITTSSRFVRQGDWVYTYLVPLAKDGSDDDKRNRYFSLGGDDDLYQAIGLVRVDSPPPPMPFSAADDPGKFLGGRVRMSTTVAAVDNSLSGGDTVYLNATGGTIRAPDVDAGDLKAGDRVAATGELSIKSVGKSEVGDPAPVVVKQSESTVSVLTLRGARLDRLPANGSAPVSKALRPRPVPLAEAATTEEPTVRTAFAATVEETATGNESLSRALATGTDGDAAIVAYPSGLDLRLDEDIYVTGVLLAEPFTPGQRRTLLSARIGVSESDRFNATNAGTNGTNANATNGTATPEGGSGGGEGSSGGGETRARGPGFGPVAGLASVLILVGVLWRRHRRE